ncbi:MAG TPA: RNA-binding protein [Clostridiales bacterium]|nr:RNA-binding protein [Clostridiales bacterium]
MDKDEQILRRRLYDLANNAYYKGICVFSDFLNLNEQSILEYTKHELPGISYFSFGGFTEAERRMICFCGDNNVKNIEDIDFPISVVSIKPQNRKFSDALTHRDYLGAVLNLGIDRSIVGDIIINDLEAFIFCTTSINEFIADNLIKIKHTNISTSIIESQEFYYEPKFKDISGTVSSIRLDSILSVAFNRSRSSLTGLIEGGKVFVNGKEVISNSHELKDNDVVSVRGQGKFLYVGTPYKTKKGRYSVKVRVYA